MFKNKVEKQKELLWAPNARAKVFGKTKGKNELNETVYNFAEIKTIWIELIPQTGKLQNQAAETILSSVTHKVKCRYQAANDITEEMYFLVDGKRMDIKFILDPYNQKEFLEIFVEQVNY